jgi:hypothetical protein
VKGSVAQADGKTPLVNAEIVANRVQVPGAPEEEIGQSFTTRADAEGKFAFRTLPSGTYEIVAYGTAHASEDDKLFVVTEGKTLDVTLPTKRTEVPLALTASSRVFLPTESVAVQVNGGTDEESLKIRIRQVRDDAFESVPDLSAYLYGVTSGRNRQDPAQLAKLVDFQNKVEPLTQKDLEGVFVQKLELGELKRGGYLLTVTAGKQVANLWLLVTDMALITKVAGSTVEAITVDLQSGKPIPGVAVSAVSGTQRISLGETNEEGFVKRTFSVPGAPNQTIFVAEKGESKAYTYTNASLAPQTQTGELLATVQTDRPIYRPGDTVQFKLTLRERLGNRFSVSANRSITAVMVDADDTEIGRQTLTTDQFGQVWGSFATTAEMRPEGAILKFESGDFRDSEYVVFAEYRKPEISVEVKPSRSQAILGEKVAVTIAATRYTGEVVPGAEVRVLINQALTWFDSEEEFSPFEEMMGGWGGEMIDELTVRTNEAGEATIFVDTGRLSRKSQGRSDAIFTINANVSEGSFSADASGSFRGIRSRTTLQTELSSNFISSGQSVVLNLKAKDIERPSLTQSLKATVEVVRQFYTRRRVNEEKISLQEVIIDSQGEANQSVTLSKPGDYLIRTVLVGEDGRRITNENYIWVPGAESGITEGSRAQIKLSLNRKKYKVGETAEAVITVTQPGTMVWFTIEGDGIQESLRILMDEKTKVVPITNLGRFVPNVEVVATAVQSKTFTAASAELRVGLEQKQLKVEITPSKTTALPGEKVSYQIRTEDATGQPISAGVGFGVVDEGIFALREDRFDPLEDFYTYRSSGVSTNYSFPEIYLDGEDKSATQVDIRRDFKDTAFWNPNVVTNESGEATVEVTLPDNLTSWRATAVAISAGTEAGKGMTNIIAQKPIMVRLNLPPYFVEEDEQSLLVTVQSTMDQDQEVKLRLATTGAQVTGPTEINLSLGAGKGTSHVFPIKISRGEEATFLVTAIAPSANDGMEKKVPVLVRGTTLMKESSGIAEPGQSETIQVPMRQGAVRKSLEVTVAPSQLGALISSLPYLVDYPYGCLEQTMSRFVPAILVRDLMRRSGISDPALEAKIQEVERQGIARIRQMQTSSGAWGWFHHSGDSALMTAIALEGLYYAKQAGSPIPESMIERGIEGGIAILKTPTQDPYQRVLERPRLANAILMHRSRVPEAMAATPEPFTFPETKFVLEPDPAILAMMAMNSGARIDLPKVQRDLAQSIKEDGDFAFAKDSSWGSSTARTLLALMMVDGQSPLIPKLMRTLFSKRRGNHWGDTATTSEVLIAAIARLNQTGEAVSGSTAEVLLNGQVVQRFDFAPGDLSSRTFSIPASELGERNELEIRNVGTGIVYWSSKSQESLTERTSDPVAVANDQNGFTILRTHHRLSSQRLEDGSMKVLPDREARTQFRAGEVYLVRATVRVTKPVRFAAVEVPVASNSVITASDNLSGEWNYWFSGMTIRDSKAVFFAESLAPGDHVFEFTVRAEVSGKSIALPAKAYPMYVPDQVASTSQAEIQVQTR